MLPVTGLDGAALGLDGGPLGPDGEPVATGGTTLWLDPEPLGLSEGLPGPAPAQPTRSNAIPTATIWIPDPRGSERATSNPFPRAHDCVLDGVGLAIDRRRYLWRQHAGAARFDPRPCLPTVVGVYALENPAHFRLKLCLRMPSACCAPPASRRVAATAPLRLKLCLRMPSACCAPPASSRVAATAPLRLKLCLRMPSACCAPPASSRVAATAPLRLAMLRSCTVQTLPKTAVRLRQNALKLPQIVPSVP